MKNYIWYWRNNQQGVAMLEFAFIAPIFITVLIGMIELTNYVKARQRVDNATANIINLVNQRKEVDSNALQYIVDSTEDVLGNYASKGWAVIITAVSKPSESCKPYAVWQIRKDSAETIKSRIADSVNLPVSYPLPIENNDHVITAEVAIHYTPIIDNTLTRRIFNLSENSIMRTLTIARPRYVRFTHDPNTQSELIPQCL